MKKTVLIILILLASLVFTCAGCSDNKESKGRGATAESQGTQAAGALAAKWPTKDWSTSTPEKQGLDERQLARTHTRIKENYPNVYSLLVIRNGFLVFEEYYNGAGKNSYNQVYSVTKSVMSALTGIAIREKLVAGTGQKAAELIPEYFDPVDNTKKRDITIENVLTMTGGLESIDNNYNGYFSSSDWLRYALDKPLTDQLGSKFVYNTGLTQILSAVISEKSGMKTKEFADKYLFKPLNIEVKRWDMDPAGCYGGGTGLYLTARDMAKFGYLYLNEGNWDGSQLIPEEWAAASITRKIEAGEGVDYGYLFWISDMENKTARKTYHTYRADGAGGQKIVVIPETNMVIVVTANINARSRDGADTQRLIEDYVIQAIK
ncbi:serine hydrolase domain-containing protein [Ruminiclostridium cellobioparum]|uniref:Beta-lactamase n=1 Tax=Ruminiclostridium cellobioparum subsp. termitidis CT1112 TaxID=1195236 RepID=S0FQZ4_RUMCE|nr:serine hydrolase [Ruminiclostridium cellobioparum]EMS71604.1 beta-lactamase [Ruminiclostridium cellobioparum subsp. termitidis CT1112]